MKRGSRLVEAVVVTAVIFHTIVAHITITHDDGYDGYDGLRMMTMKTTKSCQSLKAEADEVRKKISLLLSTDKLYCMRCVLCCDLLLL
jgi:hypothetical protein